MQKKKPNYKLRRNVAKLCLVFIVLFIIFMINRQKILNLTVYIPYMKYSSIIDSLFEVGYNKDDVKNTIEYLEKNNKITDETDDYILKLNSKGYSKDVIDYLIKNISKTELTEFLAKDYNKDYEEYIKNELFDYSKLDRYLSYQKKHKNLSIDQIITRIELNLDKTYYEDSVIINNPNDINVLTNKYLEIPEDYVPDDLVELSDDYANNMWGTIELRKDAAEAFIMMCDDARKAGIDFKAESGYRSYEHQKILYNNYAYNNNSEDTDKYAAKPGFSEHELGLAVDLANVWTIEKGTDEYNWLIRNSYNYGFILRYKKEWEDITGYAEEDWHFRYVGVDIATNVTKKGMSYEEYYIKYIANKKEQ